MNEARNGGRPRLYLAALSSAFPLFPDGALCGAGAMVKIAHFPRT